MTEVGYHTDIIGTELSNLAHQHRNGRWGFRLPLLQAIGQSLLVTQGEPWMARAWTVTLNAYLFNGGTIPDASIPPANNTQARGLRVRVEWGVDGGSETALVDYPWAGCTFQVHAAFVRVFIDNAPTASPSLPTVGGFLSPSYRSKDETIQPTFTTDLNVLGAGTKEIPLPARAAAYRIVPITKAGESTTNYTVTQDATSGPLGHESFDFSTETFGAAAPGQAWPNRHLFVPLMSNAELLIVTVDVATSFYVQFLLDLG